MSSMLNVASSPHVRSKVDTTKIMLMVIISLLPATVFGVINFGPRALALVVVTVASCVASEWVYEKIVHQKSTIGDLSAVVTGLLLGLNLPYTLPFGEAIVGSVFAIIVVKMLFGGLGQNFMNPALGARCFLLISFASDMTHFTYDGVTGATPLAQLKAGQSVNFMNMVTGRIPGTIGETSAICLLIGGIFLIAMNVIDFRIPFVYILTFAIYTLLFGGHGFDLMFMLEEICGGGLLLGAFFMATDYVTSPVTHKGRIIYAIILGVMTGLFRFQGSSSEGVSYAIIFTNLLVPLIERCTIPDAFGLSTKKGGHES